MTTKSVCLGIDPGARYVAWAVVEGRTLIERGCIVGPFVKTGTKPGTPWKETLAEIARALEDLLLLTGADVVACESTQHAISQTEQTRGQSMGQAVNTARTQEVIQELALLCQKHGLPLVMVHPASSKAALLCGRGATDGQISAAAKMVFGVDAKWPAKKHHEAIAAGVALRGQKDWQLELRAGKQIPSVDTPAEGSG